MSFIKRLFAQMPLAALLAEAEAEYSSQNYRRARKKYLCILQCEKENFPALIGLGNICFLEKKYSQALQYYYRAHRLEPQNNLALVNLANTCFETSDFSGAENFAAEAIKIDSSSKLSWQLLASSQLAQEHYVKAIMTFQKALSLDSENPWLWNSYSQALQANGDYEEALNSALKAIELDPQNNAHHLNFGYMLYEIATEETAIDVTAFADRWHDSHRENPVVQHMSAALNSEEKPAKAEAEYIRNVFDAFASGFEDVLIGLDYQVPRLIEETLNEILAPSHLSGLRILDAGCGTGFCGLFLKKHAGFRGLWGVDLSSEMLKQAALKKCYNHLINKDIIEFMNGRKKTFDLIVAADVLTYFGELDSFFAAVQSSLKKNGLILFTVSHNTYNNDDYFLHVSGRFLHNKNYVEKGLRSHGFTVEKLRQGKLRNEGEKEVCGFVIAARKA